LKLAPCPVRSVAAATFAFYLADPISSIHEFTPTDFDEVREKMLQRAERPLAHALVNKSLSPRCRREAAGGNFPQFLACKHCLRQGGFMHATIYGRGQMVIPAKARKEAHIDTGDVVNVLPEGDGRLVLVRMERPKRKPRNKVRVIRRKGKHSLLSIGRPISREEIFKALEQFPP
jgi:AbrB family looped-hinge helix DNA binding protein